jgi:hypothetical protein
MDDWLAHVRDSSRDIGSSKHQGIFGYWESCTTDGLLEKIQAIGRDRALFTTDSGYIGLGPLLLEPGDAIVVFDGAETPFVLRKVGQDPAVHFNLDPSSDIETGEAEEWQLVGDCYVHGFMNNEILRPEFRDHSRMFWLV